MSDDLDWLELERRAPGHWTFPLTPPLSRFDGKLYGGTCIAVMTALMEAETGRAPVWATVQCAASADLGDRFDCNVEVLAAGRRTSQVRVTGSVAGRLVFVATGSTGDPRPGRLEVQFGTMPPVPPPEDCAAWGPTRPEIPWAERPGWLAITEIRQAGTHMWARMEGRPLSPPALGFLADMTPSSVVRAAGRAGAGTSLDNSVRFGPAPTGDWVLVDVEPYMVSGGYVHGAARLWSEEGTLMGVASQTASLVLFD